MKFRDGSLIRDIGGRYLWLRQPDGRKEVGCAQIFQVDPGALHGAGCLVRTTRLDIEVFHQGYAGEESFTASQVREELGDPAEGFEDAVLAFECIGGGGRVVFHRELEQAIDRVSMFVEEALHPAGQGLHAGRLEEDGWVLQLRDQSF